MFRGIDIGGDAGILHRKIQDMILMMVLNVASDRSCGRAQKLLHHLAADQDGMTVDGGALAQDLRHDCPNVGVRREECFSKIVDRCRQYGRTIDWNKESGVASAIENVAQADLKGAELPALGSGIDYDEGSVGVGYGSQFANVFAGDHDYQV